MLGDHSPVEFMHDLYVTEIYTPGAIVFLRIVGVGGYIFFHFCTEEKKLYGKVVSYGRSINVIQGHPNWYHSKAYVRRPWPSIVTIIKRRCKFRLRMLSSSNTVVRYFICVTFSLLLVITISKS